MKTVWIVDGAYLYNYGKNRPNGFDYRKLKDEIIRLNGGPIHASHYLNASSDPTAEQQSAFHNWLKSAPPKGPQMQVHLFRLKELHNKCPSCGHHFDRLLQKGVDVAIATLMIRLAAQNAFDRLILSAGDGDLESAVRTLKDDLHKEVWIHGAQASLSPDLQCLADRVLWLDDMAEHIDREEQRNFEPGRLISS